MREGRVRRPFLGIQVRGEDLPDGLAREVHQPRALRVLGVEPGTPAEAGGIRTGDLLVSANGAAVVGLDDLSRAVVLGAAPEVEIGVVRDGARRTLAVRPGPERQAA
jgi:serine protease Do